MILRWILAVLSVYVGVITTSSVLRVLHEPSEAYGGDYFHQQPIVAAYTKYHEIDTSFRGYAFIEVVNTTSSNIIEDQFLINGGISNKIPIQSGFGYFHDLSINNAGIYTLRYLLMSSGGKVVSYVDSKPLTVQVGPYYSVSFHQFVGLSNGGEEFNTQPIVAITDKGGNLVNTISNGRAVVSLKFNPTNATLQSSHGPSGLTVRIFNGLAIFNGLFINKTSDSYVLKVEIEGLVMVGRQSVLSNAFQVSFGKPNSLSFVQTPETSEILAGRSFKFQPRLHVLDKGGNRILTDDESYIKVTLLHGPQASNIGPYHQLVAKSCEGEVTFSDLQINKPGNNFMLRFQLMDDCKHSIFIDTNTFSASMGDTVSLKAFRESGGAWAGGQPFLQQPILALYDAGDNPLYIDSESVVSCSMVSGIASSDKIVVIDTTDAETVFIERLYSTTLPGTYGVGEQVDILVQFSYEVRIVGNPYIRLNSSSISSTSNSFAKFIGPQGVRNTTQLFSYIVSEGAGVFEFIYDGSYSFELNSSVVIDGLNRVPNTTFSASLSNDWQDNINIDTTQVDILSISCNAQDGIYGSGEVLEFSVEFSQPVVVSSAYLTTSIYPTNFTGNFSLNSTEVSGILYKRALYSYGSGNSSIIFSYAVQEWDANEGEFLTFLNTSIFGEIFRKSTVPSQLANLSIAHVLEEFNSNYHVAIDTIRPILNATYGLLTNFSGVSYPGDIVHLFIAFDKPVTVFGKEIYLLLNSAPTSCVEFCDTEARAFFDGRSSDKILRFKYIVERYDFSDVLDIDMQWPIHVTSDAWIRRTSTMPTTDANLSFAAVLLADTTLVNSSTSVSIYGRPATVTGVFLINSSAQSANLSIGDSFFIGVNFSFPVIVTGIPVLVLHFDSGYQTAIYESTILPQTVVFKYTVKLGDSSRKLSLRFNNNALCSSFQTCWDIETDSTSENWIRTASFSPIMDADLSLAEFQGTAVDGIEVTDLIIEGDINKTTTVTNIVAQFDNSNVTCGDYVIYVVEFTDEVFFSNGINSFPLITFNSDLQASYKAGIGTTSLTFEYVHRCNSSVEEYQLFPEDLNGEYSPLLCDYDDGCQLINAVGIPVNLTLPAELIADEAILIANSDRPMIIDIYANDSFSVYREFAGVGDTIEVFVVFDKPVSVVGVPKLRLDIPRKLKSFLNSSLPTAESLIDEEVIFAFARYNQTLSSSTTVVFEYIVEVGDVSEKLCLTKFFKTLNEFSDSLLPLYSDDNQASILRSSTYPSLESNLSLVKISEYDFPFRWPWWCTEIKSSTEERIAVNGTVHPRITHVTSLVGDGVYTVGDRIIFEVHFSHFIVVQGGARLTLELDKDDKFATLTHVRNRFTGMLVPVNEYPYNKRWQKSLSLIFSYYPVVGDYTRLLEYSDTFALQLTVVGGVEGKVMLAADSPKTRVSLDLPEIGDESLSGSSSVEIDTSTAYITSIFLVNEEGVYGCGEDIEIGVQFSKNVFVVGIPVLVLETGLVDRAASYIGGSNTSTLFFMYAPQPGDASSQLDYVFGWQYEWSTKAAVQLRNKSKILSLSASPKLEADIRLNPPHSDTVDNLSVNATRGMFHFKGIGVASAGMDQVIHCYSDIASIYHGRHLEYTMSLQVSPSAEFEVQPDEIEAGSRFGYDVDIDGDVLVVGQPDKLQRQTTIQKISTSGGSPSVSYEVQIIGIVSDPIYEVVTFETLTVPKSKVIGSFRIELEGHGITREIDADVHPAYLRSVLQADIPAMGNVTVTREANTFCDCEDAFKWTISSLRRQPLTKLKLVDVNIHGIGSSISEIQTLQEQINLGGTFSLSVEHPVERSLLSSRNISVAININGMRVALEEDLKLEIIDITEVTPDVTGSRQWQITFQKTNDGEYNIPDILYNYEFLTGYNARAWQRTAYNGQGPLNGYFKLSWRDFETSWLRYNATDDEVEAALESLPVIEDVSVTRYGPTKSEEYEWLVVFDHFNRLTKYGFVEDNYGILEPMFATSDLRGKNCSVSVGYKIGSHEDQKTWHASRMGSIGTKAGSASVFRRNGNQWTHRQLLVGHQVDENDMFGKYCRHLVILIGHSVSVFGDDILIGAPLSERSGSIEIQRISCNATSGRFRLQLFGFLSDFIYFNSTSFQMRDAIEGNYGMNKDIHKLPGINLHFWNESLPLCHENNSAIIKFLSPQDGNDIPILEIVDAEMSGDVTTIEIQNATSQPNNIASLVREEGSAYLFRLTLCNKDDDRLCPDYWKEYQQLLAPDGNSGDHFGCSASLEDGFLVVGAEGVDGHRGSVLVFERCASDQKWCLAEEIDSLSYNRTTGDLFGSQISTTNELGRTIVVSAPNKYEKSGAVFIVIKWRGRYQILQMLVGPNSSPGDQFGQSIAVHGDVLVVGAVGVDDHEANARNVHDWTGPKTGAVYVYKKESAMSYWKFFQQLSPSNVRTMDQFGFQVSVQDKVIVASSHEGSDHLFTPSYAIITVTTGLDISSSFVQSPVVKLSGGFRLSWGDESHQSLYRSTRLIPSDCDDYEFEQILEEDMHLMNVYVTRTRVDSVTGGFTWTVKFLGCEREECVPKFQADTSELSGSGSVVTIHVINPFSNPKRGNVHVFRSIDDVYIEQMFLHPYTKQRIDYCGMSISMSNQYVVVGCPNREVSVQNINSGSVKIFDTSSLNLKMQQTSVILKEGKVKSVGIVRRDTESEIYSVEQVNNFTDVLIELNGIIGVQNATNGTYYVPTLNSTYESSSYVQIMASTFDRNSGSWLERNIVSLFGLHRTESMESSITDIIGAGTAFGRSQFYGSMENRSQWLGGHFDYQAVSDYDPVSQLLDVRPNVQGNMVLINSTDDKIVEAPNENVTVILNMPGTFPSFLGDMFSDISIVDDGDGIIKDNIRSTMSKKVPFEKSGPGDMFGHSIDIDEDIGIMVTGAPDSRVNGLSSAGLVSVHQRQSNGLWHEMITLQSPSAVQDGKFGEGVTVHKAYGRNQTTLAVSEAGSGRVYVYVIGSHGIPELQASLQVKEDATSADLIGPIDLYQDVLVVGAAGLESAFVYHRNSSNAETVWKGPLKLISSDYDQDIVNTKTILHKHGFGLSVSIDKRTIAVSAPTGYINDLGTAYIDMYGTERQLGFGSGRVYLFYLQPQVILISLRGDRPHTQGSFLVTIEHGELTNQTEQIYFDATEEEMKASIEGLNIVEEIRVKKVTETSGSNQVVFWQISMISLLQGEISMDLLYESFGCSECEPFLFNYTSDDSLLMKAEIVQDIGSWSEQFSVKSSDARHGDHFGTSIDIEDDLLAVGAPQGDAMTTVTWDFETGQLTGWTPYGHAFDNQPTFGDNSKYRCMNDEYCHSDYGLSSSIQGRYYIGTAEQRPIGDDLKFPSTNHSAGHYQGDYPTGYLQSAVFMILGSRISFLIGGGCDVNSEFVELMIDGAKTFRATGLCQDKMNEVVWDVSEYQGHAACIRIADLSSDEHWGHVSVDDIQFSWDVNGGTSYDTRSHTIETQAAGRVYLFERVPDVESIRIDDKIGASWSEIAAFTASDKRNGDNFGQSVSVDPIRLIVTVGAPKSAARGRPVFPFVRQATYPIPIHENKELLVRQPYSHTSMASAYRTTSMKETREGKEVGQEVESGAIYVFRKLDAVIGHNESIVILPSWQPIETFKTLAPDASSRDWFGNSIAMENHLVAVAAPGNNAMGRDSGSVYLLDIEVAKVKFLHGEYFAAEGRNDTTSIFLKRSSKDTKPLSVHYSTSDVTARGVDKTKFTKCLKLPLHKRGRECGDYEQTSGVVTFASGYDVAVFQIRIMNDMCHERFGEYVQLQLSVPGFSPLEGSNYQALLRIDDDDDQPSIEASENEICHQSHN